MEIDSQPFPVNVIDLQNSKVLVRPSQADITKGRNVIIGEQSPITSNDKILAREVFLEKTF